MRSFMIAVNAVVPFLIYIVFGYGVRRSGLVDEGFMNKLNKMIFTAFFPLLMFNNLYNVDHGLVLNWKLVITAVVSILALQAILLLTVPRIVGEDSRRGVIIQAIYRSNFVLFGIPLTSNLFGDGGAVLASMMVAIVIPIYNVTAVIILEMFNGGKVRPSVLLKNVCTNPLIMGAMTGLLFYLLNMPLALFVLGGTLHFSAIRHNLKYVVPSMTLKLLVLPAIITVIATVLGFNNLERFILFELYATPVATASYSMAQNMGGDGELAGQFVVISTAASVVTIFLWVFLFTGIGFIG